MACIAHPRDLARQGSGGAWAVAGEIETPLGRRQLGTGLEAGGGERRQARLDGESARGLAAFAGLVYAARLKSAQPKAGSGLELDVIAAAVIGGVSLSGGRGTILGAMIGSLLMGILRNGLVLLNVSAYWQQVAIGLVIILAVVIDRTTKR